MDTYEKSQERLRKLMEDVEPAPAFDDEPSEDEEDVVEKQEENSESEQDISDEELENSSSSNSLSYVGKDKTTRWRKHVPTKTVRTRKENLVKILPMSRLPTRNLKTPIEIWNYFLSPQMLDIIVENTNKHISCICKKYSRQSDARNTNVLEIKAFIGLLYYAGMLKANRLNTDELWRTDGSGVEIFRLTMSKNRFHFLLQTIRFDDKETRDERNLTNLLQ